VEGLKPPAPLPLGTRVAVTATDRLTDWPIHSVYFILLASPLFMLLEQKLFGCVAFCPVLFDKQL